MKPVKHSHLVGMTENVNEGRGVNGELPWNSPEYNVSFLLMPIFSSIHFVSVPS
jgi:hypothetical protein